jgi:hypothetical protein
MRYCIALIISFFFFSRLFAQNFLPDSVIYRISLNQTLAYNNSPATKTSGLYTGSLYVRDYFKVKGHPFFQIDSFQKGEIFYNGVLYKNTNLMYDLSHDNVIIEYVEGLRLILVPEKISYFNLSGHSFVRRNNVFSAGEAFYDLLFGGKVEILFSRTSQLEPWVKSQEFTTEFVQRNNYYIHKNGTYYRVSNKKELLDVLSDKKTDLNGFIAKNKLDFRKHFEKALLETARYYEQISR